MLDSLDIEQQREGKPSLCCIGIIVVNNSVMCELFTKLLTTVICESNCEDYVERKIPNQIRPTHAILISTDKAKAERQDMNTFKIQITETLQTVIEVQASDLDEALHMVEDDYKREAIVLDADDCVEYEIEPW